MKKLFAFLKINWVIFLLLFSYSIVYFAKTPIDNYLLDYEPNLLEATFDKETDTYNIHVQTGEIKSGYYYFDTDEKQESFIATDALSILKNGIYKGWFGLQDYLSAHVLYCLIPAFFIAGAVNTLIAQKSILKYMSAKSKKWLAYLIASVGGFFIQVCSCTILPLFAGIWKKGAGLGIATTFLYAGPAINIITFVMTGQRIGWDFSIVRLILSIVFSISIGLIMESVFRNEKKLDGNLVFADEKEISLKGKKQTIFWVILFAILIIGTAPIQDAFIKYSIVWILIFAQLVISMKWLSKENRSSWWSETLKFTGDIIPLLLVGVFFASFLTEIIPQDQFEKYLGQNTLVTNFVAVLFGAIAYFPALVEVPMAEAFLANGMHKGPLMAYLLSDPVLSLQGLLIISKLIGTKKTLVYTGSIIFLTTIVGYIYGIFV